ncbi:MAG: nucleoside monophosphate kinase [Candidatus Aminicenantes bacterium]|nr:nucleoside monophosphate kinase [Candidatus Aminicenantes bacterium]
MGDFWHGQGLAGRRCRHFDFGARLRAEAGTGALLDPVEIEIVRRTLRSGALLEDAEFPIALKILAGFVREQALGGKDILILNGLPRHAGQAERLERVVEIRAVVKLEASPQVIVTRIRADTGGDRAGRADDDPGAVAARLRLYDVRTAPLEDYYRKRGAAVLGLAIEDRTTAAEIAERFSPQLNTLFGEEAALRPRPRLGPEAGGRRLS